MDMPVTELQPGLNRADRANGVVVLTMHNPGKRNAFSAEVREGLIALLPELDADPECRAIVLTGSDNCFCSGGDISTFEDRPPMPARKAMNHAHKFVRALIDGRKPVIAAVEGPAYGGGLGLALCCDQIVAARDAKMCASFAKLGLLPDIGLLWTLQQRVPVGKAKQMLMLAEVVTGEEAGKIGLADEVVEPGQALDAALALAGRFAAMAPGVIRLTKKALAKFPMDLESELEFEATAQGLLFVSEDLQEGRKAFFEKRAPKFTGR